MRKFFLLPVFCLTVLAASCSTDDSVKMNEENSDVKLKAYSCTNIGDLEQGAAVLGSDILFFWNNGNLIRIPGRTYISKIEITDKGCIGSTSISSYTIDLFGSESYTLNGGVPAPTGGTSNCFKYRYTLTSYDGFTLYCSSSSEWFEFPN